MWLKSIQINFQIEDQVPPLQPEMTPMCLLRIFGLKLIEAFFFSLEEIDAIAGRFGFGEGCADTLSRGNPVKISEGFRSIRPKQLVGSSKLV